MVMAGVSCGYFMILLGFDVAPVDRDSSCRGMNLHPLVLRDYFINHEIRMPCQGSRFPLPLVGQGKPIPGLILSPSKPFVQILHQKKVCQRADFPSARKAGLWDVPRSE